MAIPGDTWGAHGLSVESCGYACSPGDPLPNTRIWIEDFTNHTVTSYSSMGGKFEQVGTPGVAGNQTNPLQFGKVADAYVVGGLSSAPRQFMQLMAMGAGKSCCQVPRRRGRRRNGRNRMGHWHAFDNPTVLQCIRNRVDFSC